MVWLERVLSGWHCDYAEFLTTKSLLAKPYAVSPLRDFAFIILKIAFTRGGNIVIDCTILLVVRRVFHASCSKHQQCDLSRI